MTKGWKNIALEEVLTQYTEYINAPEPKIYPKLSVKLYGKGVVLDAAVDGTALKMKRHQLARSGQVILSEIWGKKGAIGFVPLEGDGALCTSHFFLFDVNENKLEPKWLQAIFSANYLQEQLDAEAKGTTGYAAVRPKNLLAAKIPLPPLNEQRRIVRRIDELAAKIEESRWLRRQTSDEAKKLWTAGARTLLATQTSKNACPLRDLVSVKGGGTPSKDNPFFWQGAIPWVSPKDMKRRKINDAIDHISEDATRYSPAKLIEPGAVLVVVRGMILAHTFPSGVLQVPAAINQDMKALVPNEALSAEYLCSVLWALNDQVLNLVEKSSHDTRKLETSKLINFNIPVPSHKEQQDVVNQLDELQHKSDALKHLQSETAAELDALLPSVLDKAFKGEL